VPCPKTRRCSRQQPRPATSSAPACSCVLLNGTPWIVWPPTVVPSAALSVLDQLIHLGGDLYRLLLGAQPPSLYLWFWSPSTDTVTGGGAAVSKSRWRETATGISPAEEDRRCRCRWPRYAFAARFRLRLETASNDNSGHAGPGWINNGATNCARACGLGQHRPIYHQRGEYHRETSHPLLNTQSRFPFEFARAAGPARACRLVRRGLFPP